MVVLASWQPAEGAGCRIGGGGQIVRHQTPMEYTIDSHAESAPPGYVIGQRVKKLGKALYRTRCSTASVQ
jgi:hypothetical protein